MRERPVLPLAGTILQAETHGFDRQRRPFQPRYPVDPLPESTLAHLRATARQSFPQFSKLLNGSRTFSLLLDEELSPSEGTGYARTFSCRIVTIDGKSISDNIPTKLCIKLFDDSVGSVPSPTECLFLAMWSSNFYTAEDMIQNEINTYLRLEHAWGSLVPQFYGAHYVSSI